MKGMFAMTAGRPAWKGLGIAAGLTAILWAAAAGGRLAAQEGMAPPPELKKLQFFIGNATGKGQMHDPSGKTLSWTSNDKMEWTLGGMYLLGRTTVKYEGMPPAEGMMLMTYDAKEKTFKSWAFVSMMPGCLEANGNFEGSKLVLISKPIDFGLGQGPSVVRISFEPKGTAQVSYLMELKSGDKFTPLEEGVYTIKTVRAVTKKK